SSLLCYLPSQQLAKTPQLLLLLPLQPISVNITPPTPDLDSEVAHWPGNEGGGESGVAERGEEEWEGDKNSFQAAA
ncbi:Hypothetical predicted protein, partial [Marmota monax]